MKRQAVPDCRRGRGTLVGKALNCRKEDDSESTERSRVQPTSHQRKIIQLLVQGKINKEIAAILNISVRTVETHRANIMLKFGFHSLADLVLYATQQGIASVQVEGQRTRAAKKG